MWLFNKSAQHLPEATGPLVPGCMDVMLDYNEDGIFMRLYYPTNCEKDKDWSDSWCPWIPDDSYIVGIAKVLMSYVLFIRLAFWWSADMKIPAVYGAKPKTDSKLKTVILSHGFGGHRFLNSAICCELASRGFLVAALEHRDGSACNTFYYKSQEDARNKNRTLIPHKRIELGKSHHVKRSEQNSYRARECARVLDFLSDLNGGKVPHNVINDVPTSRNIQFELDDLVGNFDLDGFIMAGHSFGGSSALLTLSERPEFKCGILFDPWMFPVKDLNLEQKISQPLLFINTQTFHIATNVKVMSKFLTNEKRTKMYTILHTTHENQSDSVFLVGYWLNWFMKKLDPLVALKINNSIMLQFLNDFVDTRVEIDDCKAFLESQKDNYDYGLTKPWA